MTKKNLTVSIGVPAHNEEANIGNLLTNLLGESLPQDAILKEIIVVADGRDRTVEIVRNFQKANKVLKLIVEEATLTRKLNTMLESAQGEILVITNADTVPKTGTISFLIEPFHDETVGSVVGKAVPVNDQHNFWGYVHHLFYKWNYLPEFFRMDFEGSCSFRRALIKHIPLDVLDYEPYMDAVIREKKYKIVYAPNAITYLKAPDNLIDFLNQRQRTVAMHLQTQKRLSLPMSRLNFFKILRIVLKDVDVNPKRFFWFSTVMFLSAFCYLVAYFNLWRGKSYFNWKSIPSTKSLVVNED